MARWALRLPGAFILVCFVTATQAQEMQIHPLYEHHSRQLLEISNRLAEALDDISQANEGVTGIFTPAMQAELVRVGRTGLADLQQAIQFSTDIQRLAQDPGGCQQHILSIQQQSLEFSAFLSVFEGLDVDGEDKAEAFSAASQDFLVLSLLASEAVTGMLTTCSMQAS